MICACNGWDYFYCILKKNFAQIGYLRYRNLFANVLEEARVQTY